MKKNLVTVITLALVLVNLVLTAVLAITIIPEAQQANALITKVCTAIDLDLESGDGASADSYSIDQIDLYDIADSMTINLKDDGSGIDHYAVINVTLKINKESEAYETYFATLGDKESLIKTEINNIVSSYTLNEMKNNQETVQNEIMKDLQGIFGSDFVVGVGFSSATFQ